MGGIEYPEKNDNKQIIVSIDGKTIALPENFTWILLRHGDKASQSPTQGRELTFLGRKQVWNTTCQLIDKFGESLMKNAEVIYSPVYRVCQSKDIFMSAIGRPAEKAEKFDSLEWGPDTGDANNLAVIKVLLRFSSKLVVALGHNGLFEKIAQIVHPRQGGYEIKPGEGLIITPEGVEVIKPQLQT